MTTTVAKTKEVKELKNDVVEALKEAVVPVLKAGPKEAAASVVLPVIERTAITELLLADEPVIKSKRSTKAPEAETETAVTEEQPTDRQIRNAERVLSAAGRDHESLVSEAIAKATAMVNGGGTLFVDGKLQTPLDIKVDISHGHFEITPQERFYLPFHMGSLTKDKEFTFYRVGEIGTGTIYVLDKESSVELSSGNTSYYHRPNTCKALVVLVNSHSKNDQFLGENSLINVNSSGNVFNNTSVNNDEKARNAKLLCFNFNLDEPTPNPKVQRGSVKNGYYKRSTVINSNLGAGTFIESTINSSSIDSTGHCTLLRTDINDVIIRGSRIHINDSRIDKATINTEGRCAVAHFRASGEYISATSIYITNKFDFLKMETPVGSMSLIRTDRTTFDLGNGPYNSKRFEMNVDREELEKFVGAQISYSEEVIGSVFSNSMVAHLVDSVISRIGVIQMMSAAERLMQDVAPNYTRYEDVYSA